MVTPIAAPLPKVLILNNPHAVDPEYYTSLSKVMDITQVKREGPRDKQLVQMKQLVEEKGPFMACLWFFPAELTDGFAKIDEPLLAPLLASKTLLFTSHGGSGSDFVDLPFLTSHGVTYANNPTCATIRTADSATSYILDGLRGTWLHDAEIRRGGWVGKGKEFMARDARRSVLGIVGMGKIGKMVADNLSHMGMKVIYSNRRRLSAEDEKGANGATYEHVSFEELLRRSDVISPHCPLTEETRGLFGAKEFAAMKDGVIFINTSRGPVVSEPALVDALESGKVLRAVLDVYENEPHPHPGLIANKNTLLTPHSAVLNHTFWEEAQTEMLENLRRFVVEGKCNTPLN